MSSKLIYKFFLISSIIRAVVSGNFCFLGGPFLTPVQTNVSFPFFTIVNSKLPRRGLEGLYSTSISPKTSDKSAATASALRLNTCQDLQNSTIILKSVLLSFFFTFFLVVSLISLAHVDSLVSDFLFFATLGIFSCLQITNVHWSQRVNREYFRMVITTRFLTKRGKRTEESVHLRTYYM